MPTRSYRLMVEAYDEHSPMQKASKRWFKSGNFDVEDEECPTQSKKLICKHLDENSIQTFKKISRSNKCGPLDGMGHISEKIHIWKRFRRKKNEFHMN